MSHTKQVDEGTGSRVPGRVTSTGVSNIRFADFLIAGDTVLSGYVGDCIVETGDGSYRVVTPVGVGPSGPRRTE